MKLTSYNSPEEGIRACFGETVTITERYSVGGGDINDASCLKLSNGEEVFVKSNTVSNKSFFDAEEEGLNAIATTGAIRTPGLICKGVDKKGNFSFLMMEMIERGRQVKDSYTVFGRELADMHKADTSGFVTGGDYGFIKDNYIGASEQINTAKGSWICFFRECRLEPQINRAWRYFDEGLRGRMMKLLDRLDELLIEPERPSLLHGDLWSGNHMIGGDGKVLLIDPAVYVGHAEADLAMTELFGRLPDDFYASYSENNPMQYGYKDRRDLYNLYHMLNHLNLFGSGYLSSAAGIVRKYA